MTESTKPLEIEVPTLVDATWQSFVEQWSFAPHRPMQIPDAPQTEPLADPRVANVQIGHEEPPEPETGNQQRLPQVPRPTEPPPVRFGKRGFKALGHWEGVVEDVSDDGFYARLLPFDGTKPQRGQVEYSDFDFSDLAEESDVPLVQPGAVFYWTIGQVRLLSGTLQNTSLVRFRRVAPPSAEHLRRARALAAEITSNLLETR